MNREERERMDENNPKLEQTIEVLRSFWRIQRNFGRWGQESIKNSNLSMPQFLILQTIFPVQVISQKSLGERLLFPKSTLSASVDGLVTLGFLKRSVPEENRREVQLELTEAGREQILLMYNEPNGVYQKMMGVLSLLSAESIHTLLALHQQLYELMIDTETTENGEDTRC